MYVRDVGGLLKQAMARGQLRCIGATTSAEYKHIEEDATFARHFEVVGVLMLRRLD